MFGRAVTSSLTDAAPERGTEVAAVERHAPKEKKQKTPEPKEWPVDGAVDEAERIAQSRTGVVSFAAIGPDGKTVGFEPDRQFYSASTVKSMLLVAELRRLRREETPLDDSTRSLLEQMITVSDNEAADAIYARVGDPGLNEVAEGCRDEALLRATWATGRT